VDALPDRLELKQLRELTVSNHCRQNYLFCWFITAIICSLATASIATNKTSTAQTNTKSAEQRSITFSKVASIGTLVLIPHGGQNIGGPVPVGAAFGSVKVSVPAGDWLALELNRQAFEHPNLIDSSSETGLDGLIITFMSMDDSENRWCDTALLHANHFKNLKCLVLNRSDVSDAGMSQLHGQPDMEWITGFLTDIKGSCFKTFSQHKNLQRLEFFDVDLKQENLRYLSDCPRLSYVDFHHSGLTEVGVKYLSKCPNITTLRLGGNAKVNDTSIKYFLNMKHLSQLELDGTGTTVRGLMALKPLHLDRLKVSECDPKDVPALKTLARIVVFVPRSHGVDTRTQNLYAPLH